MKKKAEFQLLLELVKKNPNNSEINFKLGKYWFTQNELKKALIHFKLSTENNLYNSEYWLYYLFTLFKLNRVISLKKSIEKLKKLELKINFEDIYKLHNNFSKIDKFILKFINFSGFYLSDKSHIKNFHNPNLPLLTNTFLFWFETQNWQNSTLLELGAGNSTFYFSKYFREIISYESNDIWINEISKRIPNNVKLVDTKNILKKLQNQKLNIFNAILVDASENRAFIVKKLIEKNYDGLIFFDNSDIYRNSIKLLNEANFIEIPFFGIKPSESYISCTSLLLKKGKEFNFFNPNWQKYPFLSNNVNENLWDKL